MGSSGLTGVPPVRSRLAARFGGHRGRRGRHGMRRAASGWLRCLRRALSGRMLPGKGGIPPAAEERGKPVRNMPKETGRSGSRSASVRAARRKQAGFSGRGAEGQARMANDAVRNECAAFAGQDGSEGRICPGFPCNMTFFCFSLDPAEENMYNE